jgi:hypothetical protein
MTENINQQEIENDEFICPRTRELFRGPVKAKDGHVYERQAITRWILHKREKARLPYFKIFLKYEASTGEYEGSTGENEGSTGEYEGSTGENEGSTGEYEGSTRGVRRKYKGVWESRFFPLDSISKIYFNDNNKFLL